MKITNRDAITWIATRQDFQTGNRTLWGAWLPNYYLPIYSRLPGEDADALRATFENAGPRGVYVVFSYATPIGWFDGETWYVSPTKYSVTTSRHQGILRQGVAG